MLVFAGEGRYFRRKSSGTIVAMGPDGGFQLMEISWKVLMGALRLVVVSEPACRLEAY